MVNENLKNEDYKTLLVAFVIFIISLGIILLKYYNPITGFAALGIDTHPREVKSAILAYTSDAERMVDSTLAGMSYFSAPYIESAIESVNTSSQYLPFLLLIKIVILFAYLRYSGNDVKLIQLVKTLMNLFLVSLKLGVSKLSFEKKAAKKTLKVEAKIQLKKEIEVHAFKEMLSVLYSGIIVIKSGIENVIIFLAYTGYKIFTYKVTIHINTPTSTLSRGVFHQIKSSLRELVGFVSAGFLFISSRAANLATTLCSSVAIFLSEIISAPFKLLSSIKINNEVLAEPEMEEMIETEPEETAPKSWKRARKEEPSEMDRLVMLAQRLESQIQGNLHEDINLQSARPSTNPLANSSMSIALPEQTTAFTRKRAVHKIHKEIEQKTNELSSYMNELDHELNNNLHSKIKWQKERPDELTKKEVVENKKSLFSFFRR
ncbi:MAG: hypothetical protein WC471_00130 [Candidatus Woesearchaeota archaeon]